MYVTMEEYEVQGQQISKLEALLGHFIVSTESSLNQLSREMREFKAEMQDFKVEIKDFKNEMQRSYDRMDEEVRRMNKQWGELANKMGTFAEDIAAPNILRIGREMTGEDEPMYYAVRIRKRNSKNFSIRKEFDVVSEFSNYVFLNETKSSARTSDIDSFAAFARSNEFFEFFPEFTGKTLIPVFACMYMDFSLVEYATTQKIPVIGMGDKTMDFLNASVLAEYFSR